MGSGHSGHWKRSRSIYPTTFYWSAIVSIAAYCIILKLFDVESSWPWKGHWRSFKLIPFESLGAVSYPPSIVIMAVSASKNSVTLKTGLWVVQDHWKRRRSIDHIIMTFYSSAIVIIALSGTVFDLFDVEWYYDLEIWVRGHSNRYHSKAWALFPIIFV